MWTIAELVKGGMVLETNTYISRVEKSNEKRTQVATNSVILIGTSCSLLWGLVGILWWVHPVAIQQRYWYSETTNVGWGCGGIPFIECSLHLSREAESGMLADSGGGIGHMRLEEWKTGHLQLMQALSLPSNLDQGKLTGDQCLLWFMCGRHHSTGRLVPTQALIQTCKY